MAADDCCAAISALERVGADASHVDALSPGEPISGRSLNSASQEDTAKRKKRATKSRTAQKRRALPKRRTRAERRRTSAKRRSTAKRRTSAKRPTTVMRRETTKRRSAALRQPAHKRRGGGVVRKTKQKVDEALVTSFEAERPPNVEGAQDE